MSVGEKETKRGWPLSFEVAQFCSRSACIRFYLSLLALRVGQTTKARDLLESLDPQNLRIEVRRVSPDLRAASRREEAERTEIQRGRFAERFSRNSVKFLLFLSFCSLCEH